MPRKKLQLLRILMLAGVASFLWQLLTDLPLLHAGVDTLMRLGCVCTFSALALKPAFLLSPAFPSIRSLKALPEGSALFGTAGWLVAAGLLCFASALLLLWLRA